VKQYIHDRQTDVVVVKGMDATKDVEQKLNEIIGPLLDILRKRNVILPQFTDHKAISSYTLLKCQSFILGQPQNQRDNAAIGYLSAAICFLQIRTDLHKHGIGTVRSKLQKLQNDRPKGPLATIVKGETFRILWEEVEKVSCNPDAVDNDVEDKYRNNPKLKKLCEILTMHFEKSKATSASSRVIVFSQYRTSVSEIVDVLNESKPLIRARHFIGQGKSGGGSKSKSTKISGGEPQQQEMMDGMKQDEQKNVIARFKDGIYNTLVCTSIGEEGCKFFWVPRK
jgi:ERCC4-related helicase